MSIAEIKDEIRHMPLEERIELAESLLSSMTPVNPALEKEWAELAERRLSEVESGKVEPVSGQSVFEKVRKRFAS